MVNVRSFNASLAFACRSNQRFLSERPGLFAGKKDKVVCHVRDLWGVVQNNFLLDEHSQPIPDHIFCTRMSAFELVSCWLIQGLFQSGHSLHEHSYKIDADLSEIGWEYAARLKDFVLDRRAKSLKERGLDPKTSRLVVRLSKIILQV